MKNYQKENCSGKAQHFTRPLNLLFKEHPAAQTRCHFTCSPGQTWQFTRQRHQFTSSNCQFTKFTRQRHLPRAPTLLFPAATQSLRPPEHKNVANFLQNFHMSTFMYQIMTQICVKLCSKHMCQIVSLLSVSKTFIYPPEHRQA